MLILPQMDVDLVSHNLYFFDSHNLISSLPTRLCAMPYYIFAWQRVQWQSVTGRANCTTKAALVDYLHGSIITSLGVSLAVVIRDRLIVVQYLTL